MNVKNIILDLGGVLYDIDFQRAVNAFEAIGIKDFHAVYSHAQQSQLFDLFEKGDIPAEHFRNEVRRMAAREIPPQQIDDAWNALLIGIPESRMQLLEQLSKKYNLYLLSNTNEIHLSAVERHIEESYGYSRFQKCFRKTYYSNRIRLRKPDPDCFDFVLQDAQINKENVVFIDDTIRHIHGAQKCGITAMHLNLAEEDIHQLAKRISLL